MNLSDRLARTAETMNKVNIQTNTILLNHATTNHELLIDLPRQATERSISILQHNTTLPRMI